MRGMAIDMMRVCENCCGEGGFQVEGVDYWIECPPCDGSGYVPGEETLIEEDDLDIMAGP